VNILRYPRNPTLISHNGTDSREPTQRWSLTFVIGFFLCLWTGLALAGRSVFFNDPGVFWHVRVGENTLRSGHVTTLDPFSFTPPGQKWLDTHWLADVLMAIAHCIGGLDGLLQMTSLVVAWFFAIIYQRYLRQGVHPLLALLLVGLAVSAVAYHIHPRPHLASILLQGLTWSLIVDVESGQKPRAWSWLLLPLFVLWTNLHGGVVGGIATWIFCLAGWLAWYQCGQCSPLTSGRDASLFTGLGLLSCICVLVNPFGFQWFEPWLAVLQSPVVPQLIDEHRPLWVFPAKLILILVLASVYISALLGTWPVWPRVSWLIPLVWLPLAILRVRHSPLFAVTAIISLHTMLPHVRWLSWLADRGSVVSRLDPPSPMPRSNWLFPWILPLTLTAGCLGSLQVGLQVPVFGRGSARLDPERWPVGLLPELQQRENHEASGTPIFNTMYFGGFLIYFTPGYRVSMDDRCELYGDERLLEYARTEDKNPAEIEDFRKRFPFDLALVQRDSSLDAYLGTSANWHKIKQDAAGVLYQRSNAQAQE